LTFTKNNFTMFDNTYKNNVVTKEAVFNIEKLIKINM